MKNALYVKTPDAFGFFNAYMPAIRGRRWDDTYKDDYKPHLENTQDDFLNQFIKFAHIPKRAELKDWPSIAYISDKGFPMVNNRIGSGHLSLETLRERKPGLVSYASETGPVFFHKTLIEQLLNAKIYLGSGQFRPVTFASLTTDETNIDYAIFEGETIHETREGSGLDIFEPNKSLWLSFIHHEQDPESPMKNILIKNKNNLDLWIPYHCHQSINLFMTAKVRKIIDAYKSPFTRYNGRAYLPVYYNRQDLPLTAELGKGKESFHIIGYSRPLNPGETIPEEWAIGKYWRPLP